MSEPTKEGTERVEPRNGRALSSQRTPRRHGTAVIDRRYNTARHIGGYRKLIFLLDGVDRSGYNDGGCLKRTHDRGRDARATKLDRANRRDACSRGLGFIEKTVFTKRTHRKNADVACW